MAINPGIYRHFKGADYEVLGVATHSESGDSLVVYRPLYGERALWVRPLEMFAATVVHEGVEQPRFAPRRVAAEGSGESQEDSA